MNVTYDIIEKYRIEKDIIIEDMAKEIGITKDVYVNTMIGRIVKDEFIKTTPNKRNARKIERWYQNNIDEIISTLASNQVGVIR